MPHSNLSISADCRRRSPAASRAEVPRSIDAGLAQSTTRGLSRWKSLSQDESIRSVEGLAPLKRFHRSIESQAEVQRARASRPSNEDQNFYSRRHCPSFSENEPFAPAVRTSSVPAHPRNVLPSIGDTLRSGGSCTCKKSR
jgi:hypothetical protein